MSRFGVLKAEVAQRSAPPAVDVSPPQEQGAAARAKARDGKKPVIGYYSPQVRRTLHQLALDEGVSIQALLGEALDHLMRSRGKHPFGER